MWPPWKEMSYACHLSKLLLKSKFPLQSATTKTTTLELEFLSVMSPHQLQSSSLPDVTQDIFQEFSI
jgi:hypothetical protein